MGKKLTDEEIVKALECCVKEKHKDCVHCGEFVSQFDCMRNAINNALDIIQRQKDEIERLKEDYANLKERYVKVLDLNEKVITEQQAEIKRLTSLYDGQSAYMTSSIGDLPLTVEGLRKAVDEITRLLSGQAELQKLNAKYYNEAKTLRRANAELQNKVGELKLFEEKYNALAKKYMADTKTADFIQHHAVKDTAKEILDNLRNIFIEQSSYGSDVNQHIGYYEYEVKLGLVIEQIEEYAKEKYGIEYGVEVE